MKQRIAAVAKNRAVPEGNIVERIEQNQLYIVFSFFAAQLKQLVDELRRGNNSGAGIKREAVLLPNASPPAGLVAQLDDGNVVKNAIAAESLQTAPQIRSR